MSDANNAAAPDTAQKKSEGTPNPNAAAATANQQAEKPLTESRLAEILADFRNGVNADIRKATKTPEPAKEKADPDADKKKSLDEQFKELRDKQAAFEERRQKSLISNEIEAAIVALKLTGENAKMFRAYFKEEHGAQIKIEENTDKVYFEDRDMSKKTVTEIAARFFKGVEKTFIPPPSTNSGEGMQGGSGSIENLATATYAELMKKGNDKQLGEFIEKFPERFAKMEREALQTERDAVAKV